MAREHRAQPGDMFEIMFEMARMGTHLEKQCMQAKCPFGRGLTFEADQFTDFL